MRMAVRVWVMDMNNAGVLCSVFRERIILTHPFESAAGEDYGKFVGWIVLVLSLEKTTLRLVLGITIAQ